MTFVSTSCACWRDGQTVVLEYRVVNVDGVEFDDVAPCNVPCGGGAVGGLSFAATACFPVDSVRVAKGPLVILEMRQAEIGGGIMKGLGFEDR